MADNSGQSATLDDLRFALAAVENGDARSIRESALMSKAEIAAMCGVSERMIAHWENKTRPVTPGVGQIYGALLRRLEARTEQLNEQWARPQACPACVVRARLEYLTPLPHSCNRCTENRETVFEMTGDEQQ
ncbi:helix-turn-helix domain-containing protein [Micromonospora sp. NBC_00389]|uniref:helix-turn-helix domain-containing protein n=1 Tax=Micromonospora sp. NBC_00389 TaxID=2903586 RepID=UPI002E1E57BD